MKQEELDNIIRARSELISFYATLDGRGATTVSYVKQRDVASMIEIAMKCIDAALKDHVNFGPSIRK